VDVEWENRARAAVFSWLRSLQRQHPDALPGRALQNGLEFEGQSLSVLGYGPGIHKPKSLDAALSVTTRYPEPGQPPPYDDDWIDSTRLSYAYEGTDPDLWRNRAMRASWSAQLPMVYLYGVTKGRYLAEFPVYIARDRPDDLRVDLVFGAPGGDGVFVEIDGRSYGVRETRVRLHQHGFRTRVVEAYGSRCAMCDLRHASLLDAAHIVPDGMPNGLPVTPNGLSLCKIHHAAYDQRFVGIRTDHVIEVDEELLHEVDGPMLKHGIQELHGQSLRTVPRRVIDRPDPERLDWRYTQFRAGRG
jgi:putative restriction endonuclease